jgi:hemoglobin
LDEPRLAALVEHFYARVRADGMLGPVFNKAVEDWPAHLEKLAAFWSSVMLGTGRYKGQPLPAHMRHRAEISPALFRHWLRLWEETAREELAPEAAAAVVEKAQRIGASLQIAMFHLLPSRPMPLARH